MGNLFEKLKKLYSNRIVSTVALYSSSFPIIFYLCWGKEYISAKKSFIWSVDGLSQSYASFVYIHKYVRHFFSNIFISHKLVLPSWDYTIGYGSDVQIVLGNRIFDPLRVIIASLCPIEHLEIAFNLLVILKYYIVGLAFISFALYKGRTGRAAISGALVYTFAITSSIGLVHIEFINPCYYFPIIMMGVDQLWNKKFSKLYIIILLIALIDSFYFFYMTGILIAIYCVNKFFLTKYYRNGWKKVIELVKKYFTHTLIAVGMGTFAILPITINMVNMDRLHIKRIIPIFYDLGYYISLLRGFITAYESGRDWILGFSAITLVMVVAFLLNNNNSYSLLRLAFVEMTIGMCIPFFGSVMNGLNYVSNRWVFAYLFCCAYIVTVMADILPDYPIKKVAIMSIIIELYGWGILYGIDLVEIRIASAIIYSCIVSSIIFLCAVFRVSQNAYRNILMATVMCSLVLSSYYHFHMNTGGRIMSSVDYGKANDLLKNSNGQELLDEVDDSIGQRYDCIGVPYIRNASWVMGNGIGCMDMYMSLYNNNIDKMNKDLGIHTEPFSFSYKGVNGRTELEALFGSKYFIIPEDLTGVLPLDYTILFNEKMIEEVTYKAFVSTHNIGMAYLFDNCIPTEYYDFLSPEERQQILLNYVVLDNGDSHIDYKKDLSDDRVKYTINQELSISDRFSDISSYEGHNQIVLNLENISDSPGEWYVYLKNTQNVGDDREYYGITIDLMEDDSIITSRYISCATSDSHMYGEKHNWLENFGIIDRACDKVCITFNDYGKFSMDDVVVYRRLNDAIRNSLDNLKHAGDLKLSDNHMEIVVKNNNDCWLFVAQPFSKGWIARIDGKKTEVKRADGAFMAIQVPKGEHNIEFDYFTPGLRSGLLISILFFIFFYMGNRTTKTEKQEKKL